jgi:hypothetical protein
VALLTCIAASRPKRAEVFIRLAGLLVGLALTEKVRLFFRR